jgi:hypothetical protein
MKRIIIGIFVGILLWTLGCTIDQGEGTFYVDAEITSIGHTMISVKYKIGETIVFDDIPMKENMGILAMIKGTNNTTIPLRIHIEFATNTENDAEGFLKYYYGANFLSESKSFDVDALILIADENEDLFTWQFKDEKQISSKKKKKEESSSISPTTQPKKEITEKL